MTDLVCLAVGIMHMSVCVPADMTIDDVRRSANREAPTGLNHGWDISPNATFRTGEPNPCMCENDVSRVHRLLDC